MHTRKLLAENIVALTLLQALTYGAPLLTVPYLVRVLRPETYGLLSFAQAIVLYCDFTTDYGFALSATRAIAMHRHCPERITKIFWSTIFAKGVLAIGTGLILSGLVALIPTLHQTRTLYAVCFLSVIGTVTFPVWLFQGLEQMRLCAIAFGAARILTVPLLFAFVRQPQHYLRAAAIQASVEVVAALFAAPAIFQRFQVRWYRPGIRDIGESLRQSWHLFLSGAALFLCTSSVAVILGFTAGRAQVGYYTAAEKLIKASSAALAPLTQALYPHITGARVGSGAAALLLIRRSLLVTGCLSLAISVATFVLAKPVCDRVLGPSFAPSVHLLRWLSPLPVLFGLMSVLGTQTMLVFEMDSLVSWIMLTATCAGLPLTLALCLSFGAEGAAAASVLVAFIIVTAMLIVLRHRGFPVWNSELSRGYLVPVKSEA